MLEFSDFSPYFMLVGKSHSKNDDTGIEKVFLHFIFKLSNGTGFGTFRTTKEKVKLEKIISDDDLVIGGIYDVRTDKFLNDKKELITFLKDVRLVRKSA